MEVLAASKPTTLDKLADVLGGILNRGQASPVSEHGEERRRLKRSVQRNVDALHEIGPHEAGRSRERRAMQTDDCLPGGGV